MRRLSSLVCLLVGIAVLYSCQKTLQREKPLAPGEVSGTATLTPTTPTICGTPYDTTVVNYDELVVGKLSVSNDANNYYFNISENLTEYKIEQVMWIYGDENHVRSALQGIFMCGSQLPHTADQTTNYSPGQDQVSLTVPVSAIQGDCFFFHAHIKVVKRDPSTGQEYYSFWIWTNGTTNASQNQCQRYFQYCRRPCPPINCQNPRTITQGGWGAEPHGDNPGVYLHNNFAAAFPSGLTVGCSSGFKINFTSATAITNFLPAGGTPAVLKGNATNPAAKSIKNVLIGQLTALTLNVGFDNFDPNFSPSGVVLGDMVIANGPFAGKTVSQFLAIADDVLGGCSNAYTPTQVNEAATKINEGCANQNNCDFLICPGGVMR